MVKKNYKSRKKYSMVDRLKYYGEKANHGKTLKQQDYAYGYLDGVRGIKGNQTGTKACEAGNEAGLRFWSRLTRVKL